MFLTKSTGTFLMVGAPILKVYSKIIHLSQLSFFSDSIKINSVYGNKAIETLSYDGLGAGKKILFRCINKIIKI